MNKSDKALIFIFIVLFILSFYQMIMKGPVRMDDLTVEERIRYERMAFP